MTIGQMEIMAALAPREDLWVWRYRRVIVSVISAAINAALFWLSCAAVSATMGAR